MHKIIYLDHYAGSKYHGRSFRPYYLGQEWHKMGHELLVVGGSYSHLRNKQPNKIGLEIIDNIKYIWLKTPYYEGNGLKRLWSMFSFTIKLLLNIRNILRIQPNPNIIVSSTVYMLDIIPAWIISKITGAKLIFELHDLWPMTPKLLNKMSIFHPFIIMLTVAEYLCYKLCDEVVSILPLTYPYVKKFGIKPYQFKHVPNGIAITEWEQKTFLPKEIEQVFSNLKEKFVIIYAGSHAESNNLFPIIEYAKHPELSSKVQFILIGDGICKNKLIEQAQLNSLSNITFLPKIEKIHIPSLLAKADLLYFSLLPSPLYDYGISLNKLFDYMMAAKPLLQVNRTSYNLIELANCGVVVEDKTSEVVNTINSLLQADKKCLAALGENGREYVKKYHNYQSLAHKFINNEFKLD